MCEELRDKWFIVEFQRIFSTNTLVPHCTITYSYSFFLSPLYHGTFLCSLILPYSPKGTWAPPEPSDLVCHAQIFLPVAITLIRVNITKIQVFWGAEPCRLLESYRRSERSQCFHFHHHVVWTIQDESSTVLSKRRWLLNSRQSANFQNTSDTGLKNPRVPHL
jgi:hypothetical protein